MVISDVLYQKNVGIGEKTSESFGTSDFIILEMYMDYVYTWYEKQLTAEMANYKPRASLKMNRQSWHVHVCK